MYEFKMEKEGVEKMICYIKKILSVCFVLTICFTVFAGCTNTNKDEKDRFLFGENETEKIGFALSEGNVELEVDPDAEAVQVTQDFVMTNTKQIIVSVDNIQNDAEIQLFLYTADSPDNPIGYETLSAEEKKAIFSNLTSAAAYKIGATISNTSDSAKLIISD